MDIFNVNMLVCHCQINVYMAGNDCQTHSPSGLCMPLQGVILRREWEGVMRLGS